MPFPFIQLPPHIQVSILNELDATTFYRMLRTSNHMYNLIAQNRDSFRVTTLVSRAYIWSTTSIRIFTNAGEWLEKSFEETDQLRDLEVEYLHLINITDDAALEKIAEYATKLRITSTNLSVERSKLTVKLMKALNTSALLIDRHSSFEDEVIRCEAMKLVTYLSSDLRLEMPVTSLENIRSPHVVFTCNDLPTTTINAAIKQWILGERDIEVWNVSKGDGNINSTGILTNIHSICLWDREHHGASVVANRNFDHVMREASKVYAINNQSQTGRLRLAIFSSWVYLCKWAETQPDDVIVWESIRNSSRY